MLTLNDSLLLLSLRRSDEDEKVSPDSGFRSPSSDTGSDIVVKSKSTSAECIRKLFGQGMALKVRSQSCNNTKDLKKCTNVSSSSSSSSNSCSSNSSSTATCNETHQRKQRILRSPVTYTYVRGLSGLPTQRVPRRRNDTCW